MNAHPTEPSLLRRPAMDRQFIAPLPRLPVIAPDPEDPHQAWFDEADTAEWQPLDSDALAPGPAISTPTLLSIATVVMMLVAVIALAF